MEQTFRPFIEWQQSILPKKEASPQRFAAGLLEEGQEFMIEALHFDGSPESKEKMADETRDMIMRGVSLIKELKPGVNLDLFMKEKITHTVDKKYPAKKVQEYLSQGLTYDQAMARRKAEFSKSLTTN